MFFDAFWQRPRQQTYSERVTAAWLEAAPAVVVLFLIGGVSTLGALWGPGALDALFGSIEFATRSAEGLLALPLIIAYLGPGLGRLYLHDWRRAMVTMLLKWTFVLTAICVGGHALFAIAFGCANGCGGFAEPFLLGALVVSCLALVAPFGVALVSTALILRRS